ncbi:flagellar hook protein FlgE [Methylobacterium sp. J-092]|uniref:flagellar hook protein FlgE n=1 Tax=Methylobacterium sp. J-092 TaxID=2836667 RepID=UPI001FB8ACD7|nr:flagellar hook-basal body complex protein [Methylobacterium sp. J-092]MCJ2006667.1 flagellar hook-basal body complex protein [Methylobacterium sp. J-092]
MDIFTALQTAVSGLKAQSYAIDNISGNIANSQTTGYKRIDTSFVDLLAEQTPKHEVAGTVLAQSQLTNSLQGNIASSTVATNMAVNGDGFFTVQAKTGDANGQAAFSGTPVYTRRGDFAPDKDGFLVNGAGSYLQGQNYDAVTGQVSSSGPIKIANQTLAAKPTTTITYGANLPATPATTNASKAGGSALYTPEDANGLPDTSALVTATDGTATANKQVSAGNAPAFVNSSIAGPSLTAYTTTGAPVQVTTRWAKIQDAKLADATTTPATAAQPAIWNLFYAADSSADQTKSAWTNAGSGFTFDSSGQLIQPSGGDATITDMTVNGTNLGSINIAFDKTTLTQYAAASGAVTTNALTQDGYAAGTLNSVSVGTDGSIMAAFSNGSSVKLASVGIARFINPDGLKPLSNGTYAQTLDSGVPLAGLDGSTIVGASVESSNTDIASEFSKMIVTQQAYSANTKVMSTAQTMMSDLLNIIR